MQLSTILETSPLQTEIAQLIEVDDPLSSVAKSTQSNMAGSVLVHD